MKSRLYTTAVLLAALGSFVAAPPADRVGGKGVVDANFFGERWEVKAGAK